MNTSMFHRVIYAGNAPDRQGKIFLKIKITDGKLSISGVVGPLKSGNCRGSCGQVLDELPTAKPVGDLTREQLLELYVVWSRWHLNDMKAGSPAQENFLRIHEHEGSFTYTQQCDVLAKANLNPDPDYIHNGKPYNYGTAWLREELPEDVITFLTSLPVTSADYAWV